MEFLGMKTWRAKLVERDTDRVLNSATIVASDKKHAKAKALYLWGVNHSVLIGTRIEIQKAT